MKQLFFLVLILSAALNIYAQCDNNHSDNPSVNNYYRHVPVISGGLTWEEKFIIEGTGKEYISSFANNLWVAGIDDAGDVNLCVNTYFPQNPGPLNEDGSFYENPCSYFDRLWSITGYEIKSHKLKHEQGDLNIEDIPADILEWPAIGNIHFSIGEENGEVLSQDLAPFFDTNEDGIYNALDGDIPIYKSGIEFDNFEDVWAPYMFGLNIINDGNSGERYNGERLSLEILQSSYLLNCPNEQEINYTVFYNFDLTYKGDKELSGLKIGYWEDIDFGCFDNDFNGCSPELNTAFVYNEDVPEDLCFGGVEPINLSWGMSKNTILLSHEMSSFLSYNNATVGFPDSPTVGPAIAEQVYNYLCGKWLDGTPMTTGGTGYNPGSTDQTLFMLPDLPNDPEGWHMVNEGFPFGDRRIVMGIDEQESLRPGESLNIEVASHVLFDPFTSYLDIFENLEARVDDVKNAYNILQTNPHEFDDCAASSSCVDDCVWPGNILPDNQVDAKDLLLFGAVLGKGFENGNKRDQRGTIWAPHDAMDWSEEISNSNLKHADCNGDGELNELDIDVFFENYNQKIPNTSENQNRIAEYDLNGFKISYDKSFIDMSGSIVARLFNINVRPKNTDENFDFDYHGVSFDLVFDTTLLTPMAQATTFNQDFFTGTNFSAEFKEGELGEPLELKGVDRITFVITSSSGENQSPSSNIIFACPMFAKALASTTNPDGIDSTYIRMENIVFMDKDGVILEEVGYYSDTLVIGNLPVVEPPSSNQDISNLIVMDLAPNPAVDELKVILSKPTKGLLKVMNLNGIEQKSMEISNENEFVIDLIGLNSGLHFILLYDEFGKLIKEGKFIISR